ncbi:MAG: hypothetical protein KC609_18960 [Myxococcales bacterium]|nr:hypothetical protein [Myxococcales bacterium]
MTKRLMRGVLLLAVCFAIASFAHEQQAQAQYNVGQSVSVLWKGKWYAARVLAVRPNSWYIKYKGYSASWNEWVGPGRIRPRHVMHHGVYPVGTPVMVLWKGKWYPARVLQARPNSWYIKYKGYGSNWNEWVGPGRIRPR